MKNVYFITDAHLGSWAIPHGRTQERRVVSFLDSIKGRAAAVYMLGDMFDFWHEYRYVVPKGFTRFLGKISELTDLGVEVHFFTGNHDLWCGHYLERECGVILHRDTLTTEIYGREFFLSHGDGLDPKDSHYRILRAIFHDKVCQKLFSSIHPRWGMSLGLHWACHSRQKHNNVEGYFGNREDEGMVIFARQYLATHPDINYFILGHRHVDVDFMLNDTSRFIVLGDWITKFTYAVYDGRDLLIEQYVEGETKP